MKIEKQAARVVVTFSAEEVMYALGEYARRNGLDVPSRGICDVEFTQDDAQAATLTVREK